MFKIEKNIPLVATQAYPLDQMVPGDSFFIAVTDNKKINLIRAQINHMRKKSPGMVIATRKQDYGLRVWLVSKA